MEIVSLNIVGYYSYKLNDINLISYKNNEDNHNKECVICKRSLFEPSYEIISDNKNILNDTEIVIGKCGHIFHGDCITKWIKNSEIHTCPICNYKWYFHRIADTTTKLEFKKNKEKK